MKFSSQFIKDLNTFSSQNTLKQYLGRNHLVGFLGVEQIVFFEELKKEVRFPQCY